MKEIKAYVRARMLDKVVRALEEACFTDMTVIDVQAIRHGISDEDLENSFDLAERYMTAAKLAIVVRDADVDGVVATIRERGRTGGRATGSSTSARSTMRSTSGVERVGSPAWSLREKGVDREMEGLSDVGSAEP